jgi:hypothetical protein
MTAANAEIIRSFMRNLAGFDAAKKLAPCE